MMNCTMDETWTHSQQEAKRGEYKLKTSLQLESKLRVPMITGLNEELDHSHSVTRQVGKEWTFPYKGLQLAFGALIAVLTCSG